MSSKARGFTLIEILIVIGIIAILAAIVIIAINPAKQFAQARNTQRQAGINSVLNAVGQRMADNKGIFDGSFSAGAYVCPPLPVGATSTIITTGTAAANEVNLSCLVPTYISSLPEDPSVTSGADTKYKVTIQSNGRVMVCAPEAANETSVPDHATICVTR